MITKRTTINDVARLAGVSIKTVSRVFNREPHVRPSTRDKVVAAAEVEAKLKAAIRARKLEKKPKHTLVERALEAGVIDTAEEAILAEAEEARRRAVAVDSFSQREVTALRA